MMDVSPHFAEIPQCVRLRELRLVELERTQAELGARVAGLEGMLCHVQQQLNELRRRLESLRCSPDLQ